jgi:hypothetical protein
MARGVSNTGGPFVIGIIGRDPFGTSWMKRQGESWGIIRW